MAKSIVALHLLAAASIVHAQILSGVNSTWPHVYPNEPKGDYSPAWQNYFQVTEPLPNITWTLPRNFAGNIAVNRSGHANDTLFFWGFEKSNGSLTASANETSEPWGIWLNGGPGSSSLAGLTLENGPFRVLNDYSIVQNNYSWYQIADYIWIDQPVGTGFSTADKTGYVPDEDQMGADFMGFLANLVKVFPSLAKRPLHLTGESYAGTYIPYITKAYFEMENPPVNLAKIAIGDGTIGSEAVFIEASTTTTLETYPQLIGYDPDVFNYFKEQEHLCKFDVNLTYPQNGTLPTLIETPPADQAAIQYLNERKLSRSKVGKKTLVKEALRKRAHDEARNVKRDQWKRDLSGRANGTLDPWYGCFLFQEMIDYAINYTFPWTLGSFQTDAGFDVYDIPDALYPEAPQDASIFLNDNRTINAIHAPYNKTWAESINYPFGNNANGQDPSVEPMQFLDALAANATKHNISILIYSGNDDSLVPHRGSEIVIQNTTFGGVQGFSRKPSTPWTDDAGNFAGIVHQERNWTYVLVKGAGHLVPFYQPAAAYTLAREFIFGTNQTGLVTNSSGTATVVGGENPTLAAGVLPGNSEIYYGSATTVSTYVGPTASVAAWNSFIATAAPSGDAPPPIASSKSSGTRTSISGLVLSLIVFSLLQW